MSKQGSVERPGAYSSIRPLYEPMISPKLGLERSTSNLTTAFVLACSACGLNGLAVPVYATLASGSIAGVDQIPAPAKSSFGSPGGWIVQVFLTTEPDAASRKTIEPSKA